MSDNSTERPFTEDKMEVLSVRSTPVAVIQAILGVIPAVDPKATFAILTDITKILL
jgi:hypothetical protein